MRVNKFYFSLTILLFTVTSLNAQNSDKTKANRDSLLNKITDIGGKLKELSIKDTTIGFSAPLKIDTVFTNRIQEVSLQPLRDENGLLIVSYDWIPLPDNVSFRDTVIFEPAFLPVVFDGRILPSKLDFISEDKTTEGKEFHLISPDSTFAPKLKRIEEIENMRREYYMDYPQKIKLNALAFKGNNVIKEKVVEQRNPFQELLSTDNAIGINAPDIEKIRIRRVFWLKHGEHRLQLSYNKFSEKWGGDDNFDLFSHQKFSLNYKKDKIQFDNTLEWRLQLKQITSAKGADKDKPENKNRNKIYIVDDYIRTYSAFGIKAYNKWSYLGNLEMKTPVFTKKTNDAERKLQRAFLTPFELNTGLGMRYETESISKKDKYRKFKVAADISAISINYKYVGHDSIPAANFGIEEEGKRSKTDFGSTFNLNLTYSHNRYTKFTSRVKYFTNYKKVNLECENTLDFAINNYFSTTLYLYIKADDSLLRENRDQDFKFFSYNAMFRFGLTYTW